METAKSNKILNLIKSVILTVPLRCFFFFFLHITFCFSSHYCQLPIKFTSLYANLTPPGAILQENNTCRSCNLMWFCRRSGSHTNTYFYFPALGVILLIVSYLAEKLCLSVFLRQLTSILLMVVTKKLSEIQFPFYVVNLLSPEKKKSKYLMLHKGII